MIAIAVLGVVAGLLALVALALALRVREEVIKNAKRAIPTEPPKHTTPTEPPLRAGETRTTTYKFSAIRLRDYYKGVLPPSFESLFRNMDTTFSDMGKLCNEAFNPVVTCAVCSQKNRIKLGTLGVARCARCKQQLTQTIKN